MTDVYYYILWMRLSLDLLLHLTNPFIHDSIISHKTLALIQLYYIGKGFIQVKNESVK